MPNYILIIIFSILLLPGLIGSILTLPGIPYMFGVSIIYAFIDRFQHITHSEVLFLGIITLISVAVDYSSGVLGAKFSGASKRALILGVIGLFIGLFLFPPFGGFLGMFLGILIGELTNYTHYKKALKAASGSLAGVIGGALINLVLGILFLVLFIIFARS